MLFFGCEKDDGCLLSPSEEYKVFLSTKEKANGTSYWVINILDIQQNIVSTIEMQDYPVSLVVKINWDDSNRLWFQCSEDHSCFYLEKEQDYWFIYPLGFDSNTQLTAPVFPE